MVPDRVGEVFGWRAWKVIGSEKFPLLGSVTHKHDGAPVIWHPDRWTHALCGHELTCRRGGVDPAPPGVDCTCGLYAAATRRQLVSLGYANERNVVVGKGEEVKFIGEVAFAGKVIPGTQGWRAEKGRIARLYVPFHRWRYVDALEELYDVEVLIENTTKDPEEVE